MRSEGTAAELEHRRRLAVERVNEGYSTAEVAEFLGVTPRAVRLWVAAFRERGAQGLAARPVPGRPRKLTPAQETVVLSWLADSPTKYGFANELWTAKRVAEVIQWNWGIGFNPHYLSAWLRERDITPQKPQRVAAERNPEVIRRWLEMDWPRIKQKARRHDAFLVFVDESGLLLAPLVRRTLAPKGETPKISQRMRHREKVSVAATLWLSPLRDEVGLYYRVLLNESFNGLRAAILLEGLLRRLHGGSAVVVWNGGGNHRGPWVRGVQQRHRGRLWLEDFPPYAPELNPAEPVWANLKNSRLCNFTPQNGRELLGAVLHELWEIRWDQDLLWSFFHASDLPLPRKLLS
jgi:transposase